ncbi:MAG: hypothetical protein HYV63_09415 [Candidatus Schekmanbacteria bacterium]|nr:hypothetical protein [Candidatus Schekmanbacteria bacterium]
MSDQPRLSWWKLLLFWGFLLLVPTALLLVAGETLVRLSTPDLQTVKSKHFSVQMPMWLANDDNFLAMNGPQNRDAKKHSPERLEWLLLFEEDRFVRYRMKPNSAAKVLNTFSEPEVGKNVRFIVRSNERGFRTPPIPEAWPEKSFRVVSLGDSSTYGWGLNAEYTYPVRLQDYLNEQPDGRDVRTINLAMPGYTSAHGVAMWRHYAQEYRPHLVVISFGANDSRQAVRAASDMLAEGEGWRAAAQAQLRRSQLYLLLRKWIFRVYDPFDRVAAARDAGALKTIPLVSPAEYKSNLLEIIRGARAAGAESALVAVCSSPEYRHMMRRVAQAENVPFVDGHGVLYEMLEKIRNGDVGRYAYWVRYYESLYGARALAHFPLHYVSVDGCHPNPIGHDLIARALLGRLGYEPFAAELPPEADAAAGP